MKLNFLCSSHREWLTHNPENAINCCLNSLETGKIHSEDLQWAEALHYAGCAYETAEIVLSTNHLDHRNAIWFFMTSTYLLTRTLVNLNYPEESKWVYQSAIQRLKKELHSNNYDRAYINHQLACLEGERESLFFLYKNTTSDSVVESCQTGNALH